jgi:hypothetical protein
MSIDNKNLITPLLEFPHKDSFYFVQILQRKKDHKETTLGGSNNTSRLIKGYYITSVEKLNVHWEEMTKLAELFNARVSINLNPRSFEKTAFAALQKIANQMSNKDFSNVRKAYDSVCGIYQDEIDKRWLIDIDKDDLDKTEEIAKFIEGLHTLVKNKPYKILARIPSKSGMHIITNPFNLETFNKYYPNIECHKNNPTSIFIP